MTEDKGAARAEAVHRIARARFERWNYDEELWPQIRDKEKPGIEADLDALGDLLRGGEPAGGKSGPRERVGRQGMSEFFEVDETGNQWHWIITLMCVTSTGTVTNTMGGLIDADRVTTRMQAYRLIMDWATKQMPAHTGPVSTVFFSLEPNTLVKA